MFVQVLTLAIITVMLFVREPGAGARQLIGIVVPVMLAMTLWFRPASDRGYALVRDRIADVMADLPGEPLGHRGSSPPTTAAGTTSSTTATSSATTRTPTTTRRKIGAIYGPATEAVGVVGQAMLLLVGGCDGARRHAAASAS